MDKPNPPLTFNPNAAILLDDITFTIHVNRRTGVPRLSTNTPEMNFLMVLDVLITQQQAIIRKALMESLKGNPGFIPPPGFKIEDETSGGNSEGGKSV